MASLIREHRRRPRISTDCTRKFAGSRAQRGAGTGSATGSNPRSSFGRDGPGEVPRKGSPTREPRLRGSRVLVSRKWTGKTLVNHQADRAAVVREALAAAVIEMPETDRYSATATDDLGRPRFVWTPLDLNREDRSLRRQAMVMVIEQRRRWRAQYEAAKQKPGILAPPATGDSSVDGGGGGNA